MVNQICAKVYYEIATGEVLMVVSEMQGDILKSTKEDDMRLYLQLRNRNSSDIDYIDLNYGTLATTFTNAKSYKVNLDARKLEVVYYTEDELNSMQKQIQENQELSSRVSDISTYLSNADGTTISNVEDTILGVESNKVSKENGGM
ncbi:hypothetical protein [uncultured Clostridium sp.]|uniref:hypothetical protein n=1 Tax=uncultured Clostridium sp. TaxID=59620 RepID=UPI0028F03487|nr:hypothetical protein [uncultured Clostridium sp.]